MQTRWGSFVEANANLAVGYTVNVLANLAIFPFFGWEITFLQSLHVGVWFTFVSLARQYVLRRWFNGLKFGHEKQADKP